MKTRNASWRMALTRGFAALLATTIIFTVPAHGSPGDIFSIPAPLIGADPPKANDVKDGDVSVATQTGALQYSYPIALPPGRNGAAPQLALSYSSQAPIYGGPAAGWSLSTPIITLDPSRGRLRTQYPGIEQSQGSTAPADDRFVSSMAGGRPLVAVTEDAPSDVYMTYRAQNDNGFVRYQRMNPLTSFRWRALATDGTTYFFGDNASDKAGLCPLSDGHAPLTRTVDAFGNEVSYTYAFTNGDCNLIEIRYGQNANAGLSAFASVEIKSNAAPTCNGVKVGSHLDYRSGKPVVTGTRQITSVLVKAFDPAAPGTAVHTREITLGYSSSSQGCTNQHAPVRLLTSIQESAWGIDSPRVDLPAVTFTYGTPLVSQTESLAAITTPPWQDIYMGSRPVANLGWGIRRQNGDDRWPTVEAMMLDIDGDGVLDRVQNAQTTSGATHCRATWQRGIPGSTLSYGSQQFLSFGLTTNDKMPRLRWQGSVDPNAAGSATADPNYPHFESCALNGQVTAFHNSYSNETTCHDNVTACTPGTACPDGTLCGQGANIESPRTYLAYRWMDMDGDGLTDLVSAVHGSVDVYDIVRGNDLNLNGAYEPALFSTVPIPSAFPLCNGPLPERCKPLGHTMMSRNVACGGTECVLNWADINAAQSSALDEDCELEIGMMERTLTPSPNPATTGTPSSHSAQRKPYKVCQDLYPWFVFRNRGNGNFEDTPTIKYQPIPLESDFGDSALTGGVSAQHQAITDLDGDGLVDAVAQARDVEITGPIEPWWWFVWLNDGTGQMGPTRFVWQSRDYALGALNGIAVGTNIIGSSLGLFDINADGLVDHWLSNPGNVDANVAYNTGTGFKFDGSQWPPRYNGDLTSTIEPKSESWSTTTKQSGFIIEGTSFGHRRVVDLDADGRQDVVTSQTGVPYQVHFNNGGQFLAAVVSPTGFSGSPKQIQATNNNPSVGNDPYLWRLYGDLIDLDGDGLQESVTFDGFGYLQRQRHNVAASGPPRLLTSVTNGRGASTAINYSSMHDPAVVEQHPEQFWSPGRPKASPHTQWVVKSTTTTETFPSTIVSTTAYKYKNPRHGSDSEGRFAFRGFEEVTTTRQSGARTIERYGFDVDWSGRLASSLVMPTSTGNEVRTMSETTWEPRTLFGGTVTTYHPIVSQSFTCANGQTDPKAVVANPCTTAAPGYTRTTSILAPLTSTVPGGTTVLLWQETESLLQAGTSSADGDRNRTTKFALYADASTYRLRPLTTTSEHRALGSMTLFAETEQTWDSSYRVRLTSETMVDNNAANRTIARTVYDMDTGNVLEQWKPKQNAAGTTKTTYAYDPRRLFVASETNELAHQRDYTWEYGTGTKLMTDGPNVRGCITGPGCPSDATHPLKQQNKIKVDGLGRMINRWESFSGDGYLYQLYLVETNSHTAATATVPESVFHQSLIDTDGTTWMQDKAEFDGHGRPIKQTVFVQGTAPVDQITTYQYRADGTLATVNVPDPTPAANNASTVAYTYTFDSLGRPTSIRRPDSTSSPSGVDITYDGVTQITTEVVGAALGQIGVTKTVNDRFGRLAQVHEKNGTTSWAITNYGYGPDDIVSSIVDPQGVTTALVHDFAGRRVQITRNARTWKYTYDKNGNMSAEQVPGSPTPPVTDLNYTTTTIYDDLDRPLSRSIGPRDLSPADQTAFGGNTEAFYYDLDTNMKGRLRNWYSYDPAGAWTLAKDFRADIQGRPAGTTHNLRIAGYPQLSREIYQSWYAFGPQQQQRSGDVMGAGSDTTWSIYRYDARGLPLQAEIWNLASAGGATITPVGVQTRNVAGLVTKRRTTVAAPTSYVESNWSYDKLGRVTEQTVQKASTPTQIVRQDLAYFGNDDVKTLRHYLGATNRLFTHEFDLRHQLTKVTTNTKSYFTGTYEYGTAGRLTLATHARTISPTPPGSDLRPRSVNYVYGGSDPEQVTALTNVSGGATFASYTYDAAGNQLTRSYPPTNELWEYVYDGKDQLRRATRKLSGVVTGSEEYWYDEAGQRMAVVKKDASGAKTELVWFIGDTEAHYNGNGDVTKIYSHVSMGTPVARVERTGATTTSVELQFHGLASNTIAAVALNGTINASFSYAPFGEVLEATDAGAATPPAPGQGTAVHKRRFNDKFEDDIGGLTYYGARFYDKTLIGWTQSDPLYRFAPDAAWAMPRKANLYSFSLQNPLRYIDPDGRNPLVLVPLVLEAAKDATIAVIAIYTTVTTGRAIGKAAAPMASSPAIGFAGANGAIDGMAYAAQLREEEQVDGANANQVQQDNIDANAPKEETSGRADSSTAQETIPKSPTGKGTVAKEDRDPKRAFGKKANAAMLAKQGGTCGQRGCGKKLKPSEGKGHHKKRHADGGRTIPEEHVVVCDKCHKELHDGKPEKQ